MGLSDLRPTENLTLPAYSATAAERQVIAWCHFNQTGSRTMKVVVEGTLVGRGSEWTRSQPSPKHTQLCQDGDAPGVTREDDAGPRPS